MTTGEKKHLFKRTLKYDSKWLDSKQLTVLQNILRYCFGLVNIRVVKTKGGALQMNSCGRALILVYFHLQSQTLWGRMTSESTFTSSSVNLPSST